MLLNTKKDSVSKTQIQQITDREKLEVFPLRSRTNKNDYSRTIAIPYSPGCFRQRHYGKEKVKLSL